MSIAVVRIGLSRFMLFCWIAVLPGVCTATTIDFEDLSLPESNAAKQEAFSSGGAFFDGEVQLDCCWQGWRYSNSTLNQDLAVDPATVFDSNPLQLVQRTTAYRPPDGATSNYAVATFLDQLVDPATGRTASQTPIVLPQDETIVSMEIANTTWAANTIINGDAFGGPFGSDDFFRLTILGERQGVEIGSVVFLLADGPDIVDDWTEVSLRSLHGSDTLLFALSSSDTSIFGESEFLNTPSFFAVDNIVTTAVPEPATFCSLLVGSAVAFLFWSISVRGAIGSRLDIRPSKPFHTAAV